MKRNNDYYYAGITSFDDLRLEKARLILKSRLVETKIKIDIIETREVLSISSQLLSFARKFVPQEIYGFVKTIISK